MSTISPSLTFEADAPDAVARPLADKVGEAVSVLDYGAVGDGTTDDSDAIQAAVDANKGETIVLPRGYTFLAAGIALAGSSYDGTRIVVDGIFKLKASGGAKNWDVLVSASWVGFVFEDVDDWHFEAPGWLDGNRANQPNSSINDQQHLCVLVRGGHNFTTGLIRGREIRGDVLTITTKTNVSPYVEADNPSGFIIGPIYAINSADDGRQALSLISGRNGQIAGGISIKVGGRIGGVSGETMPGGFDIETDGNWHRVDNIQIGPWLVVTAGIAGVAAMGDAITSDALRDWTVTNVSIAPFTLVSTSNSFGQPIFERVRGLRVSGTHIRTGDRLDGPHLDYADRVQADFEVSGVTNGVIVGQLDWVKDFEINVRVHDHINAGLLTVGVERGIFTGQIRGAQSGAPGAVNGIIATVGARGSLTQTGVTYAVDVPYEANNMAGFLTSANLTFTGCAVQNCAYDGYPNFGTMFILPSLVPTVNVRGRNRAAAVPTDGDWARGDAVANSAPSAGGTPGWVCTTGGSTSTPFVFKARANLAA